MPTPRKSTKPVKKTPRKRTADNRPEIPASQRALHERGATSASEWKKKAAGHELEVPSGNVALVKRVGLQAFVKQGVIPNSLMPMINKAIKTGEFDVKEELGEVDAEKINDILRLYDVVVVECVVQPRVLPAPVFTAETAESEDYIGEVIPFSMREDTDDLYVDEVDFNDKVFIFQWVVGGTSDVEAFRAEQATTLESLRTGEDVVAPPINNPGD